MTEQATLTAGAALAAFAEPLGNGRRALVIGNALSSLPALLLERGTRLVHVADPDPARAAQAAAAAGSSKLSFGPWSDGLPLRDAAFDLVLIENLSALDPVRTLRETRRLLATRGVALIACPNREVARPLLPPSLPSGAELDYYSLYDAVAAEFQQVRMLGQAPFVGYAIAEFSPEGEVEPVIDSGFLARGSEEPEYFIALAAQHRAPAEAYSLVQLPASDVIVGGAASGAGAELERLRSGERQHRRRIAELEAMLKRSGQAGAVTTSLEHKLSRQDAWIRELESRAATADERADQAELEIDELRRELEKARAVPAPVTPALPPLPAEPARVGAPELDPEVTNLRAELANVRAELAGTEAELATARAELQAAREKLESQEQKLEGLRGTEDAAAGEEVTRLEHQLTERGHEVRRLEREMREAERVGKELLARLKQGNGGGIGTREPLERRLAEAEADRIAAVWAAEALHLELENQRLVALGPKDSDASSR